MFPENEPEDGRWMQGASGKAGDLSFLMRIEAQRQLSAGVHLRDKVELFDTRIRAMG